MFVKKRRQTGTCLVLQGYNCILKRVGILRPSSDSEGTSLSRLAFLAEILSSRNLSSSIDLISALLDTLSRVASSTTARADVIYVQQLLMTCLEASVSQIQVQCLL